MPLSRLMPAVVRHYLLLVILTLVGISVILRIGTLLPDSTRSPQPVTAGNTAEVDGGSVPAPLHSDHSIDAPDPLSRLLLQLAVIVIGSYFVGWIFTRLGQPAVVGEMMAGILLGPSLFGWVAPRAFQLVFAPNSLEPLHLLSQIGVCLFMFAVGMELDLAKIRNQADRLLIIGHGSIALPFLCGVALALPLYSHYARPGATFVAFALFMGISMSITAFPVLVRILKDRYIFTTSLGRIATLCAALGDVTAWCILAFVIAIAAATSLNGTLLRIGLTLFYGALMLLVVRPLLARLMRSSVREGVEPDQRALVLVSAIVLLSSFSTEQIGLHALFGAFLAGIIMPAGGGFRPKLTLRVEHFSSVLLLPAFFAFTGLRTQATLLTNGHDWLVCGAIVLVATVGKMGGTAIISRISKHGWRDSLALGALMNTRGLMELIALNIGYEMGILSMQIFTMLVLMAIITTILTGPLVHFLVRPDAVAVPPTRVRLSPTKTYR
jgi:Kef-type K+ transport system membrane component KefB